MMKHKLWEIKNVAEDLSSAELYIYSDVEEDSWLGKSETSANTFKEKLDSIADVKNLNIYINSLGGSVKEGVAIYSMLKRFEGFKTVYVDSFACSIASVIAMAADKVCMYAPSIMMIHNALCCCYGNSAELRKVADDLDKITESIKEAYIAKSNGKISYEKLTELMDKESYLSAKECIEYGLADEIVESAKQKETLENKVYRNRMQNIAAQALKFETPQEMISKTEKTTEDNAPVETNSFENKIKIFEKFMGGNKYEF